ncbi:hypothetical protein MTR67_048853 [Solanum verrucosum]|uniref:Uncharacterized protein n=1 Tax=Solanum verrucosum TaxID=315347 RepID=A0AAF0V2B5_SOLVR|nr:hypothetical protein MTR67_048853 [Solanum verrucosum]
MVVVMPTAGTVAGVITVREDDSPVIAYELRNDYCSDTMKNLIKINGFVPRLLVFSKDKKDLDLGTLEDNFVFFVVLSAIVNELRHELLL